MPPSDIDRAEIERIESLLAPGNLLRLIRASGVPCRAVQANYLRMKPGAGALVGLCIHGLEGTTPVHGYLRCHEPARASELTDKWQGRLSRPSVLGPGVVLLTDQRSVLFLFPNDARVRGMHIATDVDKQKRMLLELSELAAAGARIKGRASQFEIVRYKPERRLILHGNLALRYADGRKAQRDVFLRCFSDRRGKDLAELTAHLAAHGMHGDIPRPLGAVFDGRMFVEQRVEGVELLALVQQNAADAKAIAALLTRLHAVPVPEGALVVSRSQLLDNARQGGRTLLAMAPELTELVEEALNRLQSAARTAQNPLQLVHGDCHLHQFLVGSDGVRVVDFERACCAEPLLDLGHLIAHSRSSAIAEPEHARAFDAFAQQVLEAYVSRTALDLSGLPFYVGCGLMDRALLPFRHLEPDWRQRTRTTLEAILATLDTASTGQLVHFDPKSAPDPQRVEWVFYPDSNAQWSGYVQSKDGPRQYGVYDQCLDHFTPVFPRSDSELPGIALFPEATCVAYRVGRRATLKVTNPQACFVKLLPPRKATQVSGRWQKLASCLNSLPAPMPQVPEVLQFIPAIGAMVLSVMPGPSLHDVLMRGQLSHDLLDQLGGALAALTKVNPTELALPDHSPGRALDAWIGLVQRHDPDLAQALAAAATELCRPASTHSSPSLVHGDLHDRNILIGDSRMALIDLDGIGIGDGRLDLGNLAAHFVLRALQRAVPASMQDDDALAFLHAVRRHQPELQLADLQLLTAHTLVRLVCVYRFRSRWSHLCPDLIAAARRWAKAAESA